MQNPYWVKYHQVPGREGKAQPHLGTPTTLLAFPLFAPCSQAAEVGEKLCLPGKTVCQKVMGGFCYFCYCSDKLKWENKIDIIIDEDNIVLGTSFPPTTHDYFTPFSLLLQVSFGLP